MIGSGLGLDDRQGGQGAAAVVFIHAGGTLKKAAVEVEHVTRIGFATGRALEHEGNLAVSDGLLGKVVEDDERVHALVHEPLADGATGVGGQVLVHRTVGGGSIDDDGVLHGAGVFEGLDDTGDV